MNELLSIEPLTLAEGATSVEIIRRKHKTRAGKAIYALSKQTMEPVSGIIKSVTDFASFCWVGGRSS